MASPDIFDHPSFAPKSQPQDLSKLDLTTVPNPLPHSKFVMCRPTYLSTKIPNNKWMTGKNKVPVDVPRALTQHDRTGHIFEALGVELFEIPPVKGAQDQTYVANVALVIDESKMAIMARYKAAGRAVEVEPARQFLTQLGYKCIQPPIGSTFEGWADCKRWKSGIYFGGWGLFSNKAAFQWISNNTGIKIIPVKEIDEGTYHLDCNLLVVDENNFIVVKSGLDSQSVKTLQKCGNVIFTPDGIETTGITNGVIIPEKKIYCSGCLQPEQKEYRRACEWLLETMDKLGYTVVFFDVDSYGPSGADLSCTVLPLNP